MRGGDMEGISEGDRYDGTSVIRARSRVYVSRRSLGVDTARSSSLHGGREPDGSDVTRLININGRAFLFPFSRSVDRGAIF